MKFKSLSTIITLAILSILGIGVVQFTWFKKAFDLKDNQFNHHVNLSLQSVAEYILNYNQIEIPDVNLVEQISSNYFIVHTNAEIDVNILEHLISGEFEKRNIQMDFEYGVYDCFNDKLVYGNYVSNEIGTESTGPSRTFPKLANDAQYFGVYFPTKENTLLSQMGIWLFSTIVLIVVFAFYGVSIFILFRQKKLSDMQKDFINNLTHEFKTPLYTIMVTSDLLKQPEITENKAVSENYLNIIGQEANRLKTQIERILQIASTDKHKDKYETEPVNMHDVVKKASDAASSLLSTKSGSISFQLDATYPVVIGDQMHLENVMYNLIENAIKYCKRNPEIYIKSTNDDKYLILTVKDNGVGIDQGQFRKIFSKFYRIPSGNQHDVKGFGMGLSYVKDIVNIHRGKIDVNSEPGQGSTFEIKLPYATN